MPTVKFADSIRVYDTEDTKAVIQADSTTQYMLPPRMTTAQRDAITSPADGAMIFNTTASEYQVYHTSAWNSLGGSSTTFADNVFRVQDNGDATKQIALEASGITTATTRTITMPDANVNLAHVNDLPVANLADGTDGELITWDAAGAPATVAVGTSGQILTSNGTGAAPTFQDAVTNPPTLYHGSYALTTNTDTSSTTYSDIDGTNVKQTITLSGGETVRARFYIPKMVITLGDTLSIKLVAGATPTDTDSSSVITHSSPTVALGAVVGEWTGLSAGATDFRPQFKVAAGTETGRIPRRMPITWFIEVYS